MKKISLVFAILMFYCSISFAGTVEKMVTLTKVTSLGKTVVMVFKAVELTHDTIKYFCRDAVDSQKCETDAVAISAGTATVIGVAAGTTAGVVVGSTIGVAASTTAGVVAGVAAAPIVAFVVGGAIIGGVVGGTVYWLFSDDETE